MMPCVSQLIIDFSMSFGSLFQAILFFVHLKSFYSFYLFCLCLHARVPQSMWRSEVRSFLMEPQHQLPVLCFISFKAVSFSVFILGYFKCISVYVLSVMCTVSTRHLRRTEEDKRSSGTGDAGSCEPADGFWEPNSHSL